MHNPSNGTKKKKANCNKGSSVKMRRDDLFHILRSDTQKERMQKHSNSKNMCGEIILGNRKKVVTSSSMTFLKKIKLIVLGA